MFTTFSRFWGDFPAKLHREAREEGINQLERKQWRLACRGQACPAFQTLSFSNLGGPSAICSQSVTQRLPLMIEGWRWRKAPPRLTLLWGPSHTTCQSTSQRNEYISNSRWFCVFVLNSDSLAKSVFHVCVFASVTRWIPAICASN